MEEAEAKLTELPHHWWSDTLHHTFQVAEYWKAYMSFQRNGIKGDYVLAERRKDIDPEVDIYQGDGNRKPKGQLQKARKNVVRYRNDSRKLRDKYQHWKAAEEATTDDKAN
eukprot:8985618-Ditylum_brightwellii.AAC.1